MLHVWFGYLFNYLFRVGFDVVFCSFDYVVLRFWVFLSVNWVGVLMFTWLFGFVLLFVELLLLFRLFDVVDYLFITGWLFCLFVGNGIAFGS